MKLLQSSKMSLPIIYLVEDEKELFSIPWGIPIIRGNVKDYNKYVQLLEFEILLKSALATGLPFNWELLLKEHGYKDKWLKSLASSTFILTDISETGEEGEKIDYKETEISDYLVDISYQVDIEYLKNLNILPTWFTDIETAVKENILNSIVYNPSLYNKKLDLCSGGVDLTTPEKNLIIIDISSSIPRSISEAILLLSKTMSSQFYADLLITGSKSTLYDYTEIDSLDVQKVYSDNGMDNDQVWFKDLVSNTYRKYNTVICFGDNHSASMKWKNEFNQGTKDIKIETGKKLCKWEVKQIMSFHTTSDTELAGYADWFSTENIQYMSKWVTYLD